MPQNTQLDNESSDMKAIELAFQAVMTEYQAIREAALSRDQYRNNLLNYFVALLSAAIVALDYLIKSNLSFAFLAFSVLFSALGLVYVFNSKLNTYLLLYEHTVLRRQAEDLISRAGDRVGTQFEYKVLQWQEYYRRLTFDQHRFDGTMNLLAFGLPGILPALGSAGFFLVFFAARPPTLFSAVEVILVCLASIFGIALLLISIQAGIAQQTLWAEVNKGPSGPARSGK